MDNERIQSLIEYVTSNGRVWPYKWAEFSKLVGLNRPGLLPPLILGGAMESDLAKRQRLIDQINYVSNDEEMFEAADRFLRSLKDDQWHRVFGPLTDEDHWGFRHWQHVSDDEAKMRPSAEVLDEKLKYLVDHWSEVAGPQLSTCTVPFKFSGRKRRRLLVYVVNSGQPPWGSWTEITTNRSSFRVFRAAVNEVISPVEVDHIEFIVA